ncbi:MAG TPA: hypothetical protein VJB39_03370 [Patescibacteria group bacterium]|nr:hypothetical protein [Patescibacteria group bacterium]
MSDIKRAGQFKAQAESEEPMMAQAPAREKNGWITKLVVIVLIIVVILVGLYLVSRYTSWNVLNVNRGVSSSGWQAVFLSNGQVYFGKIAKKNSETVVLREVYYLQVTQQLQPTPEDQSPQQNLSLVKLGNELHGPRDEMRINRDHVIFTEDLKSDSRVVDAIIRYLEEQ